MEEKQLIDSSQSNVQEASVHVSELKWHRYSFSLSVSGSILNAFRSYVLVYSWQPLNAYLVHWGLLC